MEPENEKIEEKSNGQEQSAEKITELMNETLASPSQQPAQPQPLQFPCPNCPGITLKIAYPQLVLNNDPAVSSLLIPHDIHECPFCHTKFGLLVMGVQITQWGIMPVAVGGPPLIKPATQLPKLKLT